MTPWTREALAARVDSFAREHRGRALVEVVGRFARELEPEAREVLGQVLLERARREGAFDAAYVERVGARGWFRRRLEAAERRARTRHN